MSTCAVMLYEEVDLGHASPCWVWKGPTRNGKPLIRINRRYIYVYRHFWEEEHGALDSKAQLLRQCREKLCVNIGHYRFSRRALGMPLRDEALAAEKQRDWNLSRYGITAKDYDTLLEAQGGVCAVCGRNARDRLGRRLHVDHCHETGTVRGLLCSNCNNAIGHAGEAADRLRALADYLERRPPSLRAQ